ncbi:S-locus-specific glycoprotein S13-like [Zingiber officinale]|uniref:S-locus-specific glycoprotein S13-like n=1 Tax=Zingiber officinale TaxID=94328 RepID=UPI001C4D7847|nr:S-locus-specific glycoprotein S13-like [Zingiber officinale]
MGRMQLFLLQFLEIVLVETFFLLGQSSSGELVAQFDIMAGNSSLINNQTLISAGSMFQLGFFSPVNNSATAYIGIWYYNHPPRENKVVWVANRDKSVDASMASLNLTSDGNLILFEEGTKVWSTGTSAELNSARLQLLDSGNLALTAGNSNRTVWQSFDHACDTILPGMKLGFDFRTNTPWQFVSWMSATDPSPGKYIVKMETYKVPDFLILSVNGSAKLGRTGPWNGQCLSVIKALGSEKSKNGVSLLGGPKTRERLGDLGSIVGGEPACIHEVFWDYPNTVSSFLILSFPKIVVSLSVLLIFDGREWNSFLSLPRDDCDNYNSCGNNSVCTKGYYSISCRCLEGLVEIGSVVGCKRKEPFRCSSNQFRKEPSVKVPDTENATSRGKISLEACNKLCLDDCSCVAYAVINGPYGCITWRGDLLDLRSFPDGGDDLYIRLQGSRVMHA